MSHGQIKRLDAHTRHNKELRPGRRSRKHASGDMYVPMRADRRLTTPSPWRRETLSSFSADNGGIVSAALHNYLLFGGC
jgi:hypothetical protein